MLHTFNVVFKQGVTPSDFAAAVVEKVDFLLVSGFAIQSKPTKHPSAGMAILYDSMSNENGLEVTATMMFSVNKSLKGSPVKGLTEKIRILNLFWMRFFCQTVRVFCSKVLLF